MGNDVSATTTLALQINEALAESHRLAESAVVEAARAGRLMIEAKQQLPHGQWGQWVQDNCHMTDRNARRYMQLARELPKLEGERRAEVMALPIREAVQAIGKAKPPKRVDAKKNGHGVSVLTENGPASTPRVAQPQAEMVVRPALAQRWMRVFGKFADPRILGRILWHYVTEKLHRKPALQSGVKR